MADQLAARARASDWSHFTSLAGLVQRAGAEGSGQPPLSRKAALP